MWSPGSAAGGSPEGFAQHHWIPSLLRPNPVYPAIGASPRPYWPELQLKSYAEFIGFANACWRLSRSLTSSLQRIRRGTDSQASSCSLCIAGTLQLLPSTTDNISWYPERWWALPYHCPWTSLGRSYFVPFFQRVLASGIHSWDPPTCPSGPHSPCSLRCPIESS